MLDRRPKLPVQQLIVLSICRFAEPVVLTSVLPYLPEMIEHLGVAKDEVAKWVGITSFVTAICQCTMAVPWGTASDYVGRKPTILMGLTFTMIFSLIFGFSRNLVMLLWARALLGLMNGNVGIIRTMVAEMVPEKELQPRAFSVMPLVWTIGTIFGPAFGGSLARPAEKHSNLFGGSAFWRKYPFLLPNMASAAFFVIGISTGFLFLRETLETRKDKRDYGLLLGQILTRPCRACTSHKRASDVKAQDERTALLNEQTAEQARDKKKKTRRPSWREVFSPQSNLVLVAYAMLAMHNMAFDSLLPVFLHYPEQNMENNPMVNLPFKFIGGFGVESQTIGFFYTFIGIFGMFAQFFFFPRIAKRYGILPCTKLVYCAFPLLYFLTPFTALFPTRTLRNTSIFTIMLAKSTASIFGFPCCTILLTNSAASLRILGTLNGVGTSVSALGRAVGPAIAGATFSFGVKRGFVIVPWWTLAVLAGVSAVPVFWIRETDGFGGHDDDFDDDSDEHNDDGSDEEEAVENVHADYGAVDTNTAVSKSPVDQPDNQSDHY